MEIDASYLLKLDLLLEKMTLCGAIAPTVAGGAIRDMLLQKEVADIDVFYKGDLEDKLVNNLWPNNKLYPTHTYPDGFTVTYNVIDDFFPVKVQFINVESISKHISTFPTPLSRVWYNITTGLGGIDKLFCACVEEKKLLFDLVVDLNYFNKLEAKFSEYSFAFTKPEFSPLLDNMF